MILAVGCEKNTHANTLVDPCVVCQKNTHAMTLALVNEKNTHAMTLVDPYVVCEKNKHAMTLMDPSDERGEEKDGITLWERYGE